MLAGILMSSEPVLLANRYRIVSELGRGAMGVVYRVADTLAGDVPLALKAVQIAGPGGAQGEITPEWRLLFKEEFRAMSRLQHPNTIAVVDYGQLDAHTQFFTMAIVEGRELSSIVADGPLPFARIYDLLSQLLLALGFIHGRLYVHRDIKSANIRIGQDADGRERLVLMDFGLMTQLGLPSTGRVSGTPGYMAPEVVKGGALDASSDLYSVGCLAYEMMTGQLPFRGKLIEVVRAQVNQAVLAPRVLRPDVPERLEALVLKLLAKEQGHRYREASEVIADLAELAGIASTRQNIAQKRSYLISSHLVAREVEMAVLHEALATIQSGCGAAVFVGAPAGVGKSRLVGEFLLAAKLNEVPILGGTCLESGMGGYEPLAQALRPLLALTTPGERAALAPEILGLFDHMNGQVDRLRLQEGIADWLATVATRTPLILFLDDLHWADRATLAVFNHCIGALSHHRVLCLGTLRCDETPDSSPAWYTVDDGPTRYIALAPFDRSQMVTLIHAMLHQVRLSDPYARYLFAATAGNAFFVTEALRSLMEEQVLNWRDGWWCFPVETGNLVLLEGVELTVVKRLARLDPEARRLAQVASVIGRFQSLDMLLAVGHFDEDVLLTQLDELVARQFLERVSVRENMGAGSQYRFPHDRVREALYAEMPHEDRVRFHGRCGAYIETHHGAEACLDELAYHFARSDDSWRAYHYLCRCGDRARASGASEAALKHWLAADVALSAVDRPDKEALQSRLWWGLGAAAFYMAPGVSIDAFERLLPRMEAQYREMVASGGSALEAVVATLMEGYGYLSVAYAYAGEPLKGLACAERSVGLVSFKGTGLPLEGAQRMLMAPIFWNMGRFDEAIAVALSTVPLLFGRDVSSDRMAMVARIGAMGYQNSCTLQGIRPDLVVTERTLKAGEDVQDLTVFTDTWSNQAVWHAWTGRHEEALEIIDRVAQHCRRIGAPPYAWVLYLRPYMHWQGGEFEEAIALIQQARRFPSLTEGQYMANAMVDLLEGSIRLGRREYPQARAIFERTLADGRQREMHLLTLRALLGLGQLDLAEGQGPAARSSLSEALSLAEVGPAHNALHEAFAARFLGEAALAEGAPGEAARCLRRALAIWQRPEQDNMIQQAHTHRTLGHVASHVKDFVSAEASLREAGELFYVLKNRHFLHGVTRDLEALRQRRVERSAVTAFDPGSLPTIPPAAEFMMAKWAHLRGI